MIRNQTCKTCHWWDLQTWFGPDNDAAMGYCHYLPPVPKAGCPETHNSNFCSKWKRRVDPQAEMDAAEAVNYLDAVTTSADRAPADPE